RVLQSAPAAAGPKSPALLFFRSTWRGARRLFDLDRGPVVELAHRCEGPDDHVVAVFHASEDLEILVPGDAGLDRHELGFVVANDEHAFELFARLPGFELRGLHRARSRTLRGFRLGAPYDLALFVDHHL